MGANQTSFNSETGSAAGKKGGPISKRKGFDQRMQEWMLTPIRELKNDKIREAAEALGTSLDPDATVEDMLRESLLINGLRGNTQAATEALNRTYGRTKKGSEVGDGPTSREPKEFVIVADTSRIKEVPMIANSSNNNQEEPKWEKATKELRPPWKKP